MTNENGIKQLGNDFNGVILSYYTTAEVFNWKYGCHKSHSALW